MAGKLTLDELKQAGANGEIDTVLAVLVDMQGRLMGKRMHIDFLSIVRGKKPIAAIICLPPTWRWKRLMGINRPVGKRGMAIM